MNSRNGYKKVKRFSKFVGRESKLKLFEKDDGGYVIELRNYGQCMELWEYDSNNNLTYTEDCAGYWQRWEYNLDNKKKYFENAAGFWERYDKQGNTIDEGIIWQ